MMLFPKMSDTTKVVSRMQWVNLLLNVEVLAYNTVHKTIKVHQSQENWTLGGSDSGSIGLTRPISQQDLLFPNELWN